MAFELSRVDRLTKTYDLAARFPDLDGPFTAASVALLPPRSGPNAATVWYAAAVAGGIATVLFAGPDADSTGAVVVPASADLWLKVTDSPETDAKKIERITVIGGGAVLAVPTGVPVVSVNGHLGGTITLDAADVGAMAPGDGAGGALSGTYPSPGLNETTVDTVVAGKVGTPGSGTAVALRANLATADVDGAPILVGKKLAVATTAYSTLRLLRADTRDVTLMFLGDSTLLQTKPWPKTFLTSLAAQYPAFTAIYHKWNDANSNFDAGETLQTGTGTHTLHLWNFSMSGKTTQYYQGALWPIATGLLNADPDLMLISQGHNEPLNADQFRSRLIGLSEYVRGVYPLADLFLMSENPATTGTANLTRSQEVQRISSLRGYGFINVTDLFLSLGASMSTYIQGDGIHPTEGGMDLIAGLVMSHFTWGTGALPRDSAPSTLGQPTENMIADPTFASWGGAGVPTGWTATGTTTAAKDLTNFETGTFGVRLTSSAASASFVYDVDPSYLGALKGRYVCLAVKLRVPSGQATGVGRIGLDWGGGSNVQSQLLEGQGGFRWAVQHVKIPTTATRVRVLIFASDSTATSGGDVTIDRVTLSRGLFPRDVPFTPAVAATVTAATGFGFPATLDTAGLRGSDLQTLTANRAVFMRCRDGGTISKVSLGIGVSSGNISVAAYSNSGSGRAAQPGALLAASGSVACPVAGYAEIDLGATVTLAPGDWLAICPDNATVSFRAGTTGLLTNSLGTGREYVRDNSFPLSGSNPTSLQASLGPPIALVGA